MFSDRALVQERAAETARLLRALANPQRLLILCHLLKNGETGAGELTRHFKMGRSALSQHLACMREEALISQRREGRALHYRINDDLDARLPALLEAICEPEPGDPSMHQFTRAAAAVSLAFTSTMALAGNGFWETPTIHGAGQMHPLPHAAYQPDPDATYKVVFALTKASDDPAKISPALQRVARAVNLYTTAGVPLQHLKFVAIAYGAATVIALDDAHYRQQYGVANPNLPVIRQLHDDGIDVAVCGQAVAEHKYDDAWIDPDVTLALSGLTTITELQQKGYALMPL